LRITRQGLVTLTIPLSGLMVPREYDLSAGVLKSILVKAVPRGFAFMAFEHITVAFSRSGTSVREMSFLKYIR